MASSGSAAWAKHFQGKGDLETSMKKTSPAYDAMDVNKKFGDIPAGTKVTYLKSAKYEQKALIQFEVNRKIYRVRVPFDNLAKPGSSGSGSPSLKPQAFGLASDSKTWSIQEYTNKLKESIESRTDLSGPLRTYLSALVNYYTNGTTKNDLMKIFANSKADLPIADINKDFGEVLGPIASYKLQLFKGKKITLPATIAISVPMRPNEPLMDYGIYTSSKKEKLYTISAKSGKSTNTVKPQDIIELLKKDQASYRTLSQTKEFRVLEELANASIVIGPLRAVSYLYPKLVTPAAAAKTDGKTYDVSGFAGLINESEYLRKQKNPTIQEVRYECEKIIEKETKTGSLNMNQIFSKAINNKVLYVKFELDNSGVPIWGIIAADDISATDFGRVFLRTKNGYTRAADKLGIQI